MKKERIKSHESVFHLPFTLIINFAIRNYETQNDYYRHLIQPVSFLPTSSSSRTQAQPSSTHFLVLTTDDV